jgi:two-component system, OmpR family, response regulator
MKPNELPQRALATLVVVDDDRDIRTLLAEYLGQAGYHVLPAADGVELDRCLAQANADLIVLDVMLPGEDGFSICRRLRATRDTPVMMLTAVGDPVDRVIGLELGADDYVAKPFLPRELLARIRAVLKRRTGQAVRQPNGTKCYRFAGWVLDEMTCTVQRDGEPAQELTGGEYRLLHALVRAPGRVFTRDDIARIVNGRDVAPYERSVDVAISRMRRRLGDSARTPTLIATVHALGYVFRGKVEVIEA